MFTLEERERVRHHILEMARADERIAAAAEVGGMALGGGDRWSDLDLTFGLAPVASVTDVLADWTDRVERELGGIQLFDVPFLSTIYRVFLLPGNLQVDLSFTPGAEFGALGPRFSLLYGTAVERPRRPPSPRDLFGLGVHHAVRARISIERGRYWQAEYWISGVRDQALALACLHRGLDASHARGFDDLPSSIRHRLTEALVSSLERDELLRALGSAIAALLENSEDVRDVASRLAFQLREL